MKVIDNYIKDKNILRRIKEDSSFFPGPMNDGEKLVEEPNSYHHEESSCFAPYMFWDGWWRSPASTLKKEIIKLIWENNLEHDLEDILGFEYWTRTYKAGQYLPYHVDEDTFLYEKDRIYVGPILGSIYYGCENEDGGFLEIHPKKLEDYTKDALEQERVSDYIAPLEKRERIAYKSNRLIMFDAGHVIHNATAANSGIREVLVVNVWHRSVPPTALSIGSFYYE
jgi:hypothetical protein